MIRPTASSIVPLLMLAKLAASIGCNTHSFTTCDDGIVHWYDPEDGQICDPLDCGGGRAPPKKNPGCDGYTGTEVRTISYLSCWKDFATFAESFTSAAEPTTEAEVESETDSQPAETESSESSPSTTTAVDSSTATSAAVTTSPATLSTRTQTSVGDETATEDDASTAEAEKTTEGSSVSKAGNEASSAESEASTAGNAASTAENEATTPTTTPNASQVLRGSVVTVFGFAIGAIVFL
ncbi:hypothetical protein NCS52_00168400 [Fusarium sp. LHS14.1]|nr:hypothetical protein NCS52_00168400 [Fusarium sp. LHS14.1]